jgi:4-hydroxy-tetrahydrodipicolinate synthase
MNQQIFKGTGVALVTPLSNGKVDYAALERVINHVLEGGVDYLVSLGTTGEAVTLSRKECRAVLDFTIKINNGRLPIVAGHFGHNRTDYLVEQIKEFDFTGVDAVLSSSPSYIKPSQEGIFQHYMKVEEVCPKPIIIYNVPGRTASNISAETTIRLANASPKFIAIKEATGDIVQGSKIIKEAPEDFLVLSGDDPTALALIACGGHGVISVIANAFPAQCSSMIRALFNTDYKTAQALNLQLLDLHQWLYIDGNPSGIKAAMEILGLCSKEVRLPLVPIQERNYRNLKIEIEKAIQNKELGLRIED